MRIAVALLCLLSVQVACFAETPPPPEIVARATWRAAPARTELMKPQKPSGIVLHHTGVRQQRKVSLETKMRGLQSFSMSPGTVGKTAKPAWGDMPYHYYIDVSGRIGEGRDVAFAGDTNTKYDTMNQILIVVEGHFDGENPADAQITALLELVSWLAKKHGIDPAMITGHDDHAATDCPGKKLKVYLPALRNAARSPVVRRQPPPALPKDKSTGPAPRLPSPDKPAEHPAARK